MSFARESALTAGEQVILVQLSFARLATYGLKTSDGATLHVPAVATAADTAAVYVDRTRYESPLSFCVARRYVRGG